MIKEIVQLLLPGYEHYRREIETQGTDKPRDIRVGCAKRLVVAIPKKGRRHWIGFNQTGVPSLACFKTWSGEPFGICDMHCGGVLHAEIDALNKAGRHARGATLYLMGQSFCCQSCTLALKEAGVVDIKYNYAPLL